MSDRGKAWQRLLPAIGFITPNLLIFTVFTAGPILFTLGLAFFKWDPFAGGEFVGFGNFNAILSDSTFWYYLFNTLIFMLGLPLSMAGSLFLAVLLTQKLRGIVAYRTIYYLPSITNGVALFLLWKVMYNREAGLINTMLLPLVQIFDPSMTASGMPDWLNDSWSFFGVEFFLAKPALIAMGVWAAIGGGNMILYLAALAGVPQELYEAADIDGASRWQKFKDITWPMIAPTTFFIFVMGMIGGLQGGFEMAYMMTEGGPEESTTTIGYYIFTEAFSNLRFGFAAAVSFILFLLIILVTMINWRFGSKAGGY